MPTDTDSDIPSSALAYSLTHLSTANIQLHCPISLHPTFRVCHQFFPGTVTEPLTTGRERKSIDYCMPSRNSPGKMRKPDLMTMPSQVKRASSGSSQLPAVDDIAKDAGRGWKSRQ
jgi:hypothetical protein